MNLSHEEERMMDTGTHQLIDDFVAYLSKEFHERKSFKKVQIIKWHLQNNRVTIDIAINEQPEKIYMDIREIKDNRDHFSHMLNNLLDQISEKYP